MLCAPHGEAVERVVPYHERHGRERLRELAQDEHGGRAVATIGVTGGGGGRRALDPHVHEAMG